MATKTVSPMDLVTDRVSEIEGKELIYEEFGFSIFVKRAGGHNRTFYQVYFAEVEAFCLRRAKLQKLSPSQLIDVEKELTTEDYDEIFARTYAKNIVTGWKNFNDAKGRPIKFNEKNATFFLLNAREIYEKIHLYVGAISSFKREVLASEVEILGKP